MCFVMKGLDRAPPTPPRDPSVVLAPGSVLLRKLLRHVVREQPLSNALISFPVGPHRGLDSSRKPGRMNAGMLFPPFHASWVPQTLRSEQTLPAGK